MFSVFSIISVYTSWTRMFIEATFREILLPSLGNVNNYVTYLYGSTQLFQEYLPEAYLFPWETYTMELLSEKAQSLTFEKGHKYAYVFFLYRTTTFESKGFFSFWGYCSNQNFLFKLLILDINTWRFHHST